VAVEGGRVPAADWVLSLQILPCGVFRCVERHSAASSGGMWE
jgi:hypothetical protein